MSDAINNDATNLPVQTLIKRLHRHILAGRLTRGLMIALFVGGTMLFFSPLREHIAGSVGGNLGGGVMAGALAWYTLMTTRTLRNHQNAMRAGQMLDAGRFDEAERAINEGLSRFALHRAPKLASLHHLAAMRYAQRRHSDAAELAMELLRHTRDPASRRNLNLMLADCALELNNLAIAQSALASVGGAMPLRDTLKLMELQVEYCARIGAWPQVIDQLPTKVELAELLATEPAQRVQALMALAALKQGRPDWAAWLRRRVELLGDITSLLNRRPALSDLFA